MDPEQHALFLVGAAGGGGGAQPGLPLSYALLAYYVTHGCIARVDASAVKRAVWLLSLSLAQIRIDRFAGDGGAPLSRLLAIVPLKIKIWNFLDVAAPSALSVEIAGPPTNEYNSDYTVARMLAGTNVWYTTDLLARQVESVLLSVAAGSHVMSFDIASFRSAAMLEMRVEEVDAGVAVGATIVPWRHYGTLRRAGYKPSHYTPVTIAVETTATRFKVSVRRTHDGPDSGSEESPRVTMALPMHAGVAIFRASGVPSPPRPPLNYEQLAYFIDKRYIAAKHESAVKRAIWNLTIGLAHVRAATSSFLFQAMQSATLRLKIWKYLDVAKLVELKAEIATTPTNENGICTVANMLAGTSTWCTKLRGTGCVDSVVLSVAAGTIVTSFDVASYFSMGTLTTNPQRIMSVDEVTPDDAFVATLVPWGHYGTPRTLPLHEQGRHVYDKQAHYTPVTIAVDTAATRFRINVCHTSEVQALRAGVAIFRAMGIAPSEL